MESLRRSTGGAISGLKSKAQTITEKPAKKRRLSVVEETDDVAAAANFKVPGHVRRDSVDRVEPKEVSAKPAVPTKTSKKESYLQPIPKWTKLEEAPKKAILSPVPLPPDVICIDPIDDSTLVYAADIVTYSRMREKEFQVVAIKGNHKNVAARNNVVSWMVDVLHYLHSGQKTVYYAVNLFDRVVGKISVDFELLQLLAITCILIATKLEEYYTADIKDLLVCTQNSYSHRQVLRMETKVYRTVNFRCFGEEPTVFVERCIHAAFREGDRLFWELSMFLLDTIIIDFSKWSCPSSLKATAAVYAALHLPVSDTKEGANIPGGKIWTPTLQFYSTYSETDLAKLAIEMLTAAKLVVVSDKEEMKDALLASVKSKFSSAGRHRGVLKHSGLTNSNITLAMACISKHL